MNLFVPRKMSSLPQNPIAPEEEKPKELDFFEILMADLAEYGKENPEEKEEGYFSWNNFTELTNLQNHIDFAQQLLDAYQWPTEVYQELHAQMQLIRIKQQDKALNMSVIGEFSSGKSTFINALLRKNLLAECVQQGTTVAATVLGYAKAARIQSRYKDGRYTRKDYHDLTLLKEQLNAIVANNDEAIALDQVVVGLPLDWLKKQRFRIIDTPGLNSLNQWHDEVTTHTIQDISDVSIILTEANRPMPESLCNFIEANLSHILQHCVFVVTKFDLLQPKERDRVLKFVAVKAKQLGIEDPLVVPYASLEVLKAAEAQDKPESEVAEQLNAELLELSHASEQSIFAHMGRNRAVAQAKNLVALVNRLYDEINRQLLDKTKDCEERIKALEAARTRDLKPFLEEQKKEREAQYRLSAENSRMSVRNACLKNFSPFFDQENSDSIPAKVNAVTSVNSMKPLVNSFEGVFLEAMKKAFEDAQQEISAGCGNRLFCSVHHVFAREFLSQFKELDRLNLEELTTSIQISEQDVVITGNTASLAKQMSSIASDSNMSIVLGGGGGALLSLILLGLGPLGWIIGGVGGILLGAGYRAQMLAEAKEKVIEELEKYCTELRDGTIAAALKTMDDYIDRVAVQLHTEIDRYYTAYHGIIDQRLLQEKNKREALDVEVSGLRQDMKTITSRRQELSTLIGRIS